MDPILYDGSWYFGITKFSHIHEYIVVISQRLRIPPPELPRGDAELGLTLRNGSQWVLLKVTVRSGVHNGVSHFDILWSDPNDSPGDHILQYQLAPMQFYKDPHWAPNPRLGT